MDFIAMLFQIYSEKLVPALIILFVLIFLIKKTPKTTHSTWNTMIGDFNYSVEEFFTIVKEELKKQEISGLSFEHKHIRDGSLGVLKREYLRIYWNEYYYDLGAMPFGKGFYISWWLIYKDSVGKIIINKIPFIGGWLVRKLYKTTYYKVNIASAFMTLTHSCILKAIETITEGKTSNSLDIKKPIMNDVFKR